MSGCKDSIHKEILRLALPSIVTNITVPLLGIADTAIVGHMGRAGYIAAIAVCSTIFNMIYWIFAFLRMGTTGLVAQAWGRGTVGRSNTILTQALLLGNAIGLLIILCNGMILQGAYRFMDIGLNLKEDVSAYYNICVWGAPAMLSQYALTGWFIGSQNTKVPMIVAISQNIINILLSAWLVFGAGMKMEGVAIGTAFAQYFGCLAACLMAWKSGWRPDTDFRALTEGLPVFFNVNRDIFLRTLCLVAVTVFFTRAGNAQGGLVLSCNTLLMQFFILYSYFTDGWANAGEALGGRYASASHRKELGAVVKGLFIQVGLFSLATTLAYMFAGTYIVGLFTDLEDVIATSHTYLPWVYAIPVAAMTAMTWDGIFIGLTLTRGMLLSMCAAMLLFFGLYHATQGLMHNHGLWLAFVAYLTCRGLVQTIYFRKLKRIQITQTTQITQN